MAEPPRNRDPNAPQNPPRSVVNKDVRRTALRTYLIPLVLFFVGIALVFAMWRTSPPARNDERAEPRAEGTTGTERERARERTPGGHNPDRTPSSTREEVEERGGRTITELSDVFENESRNAIGRRVELRGVQVRRVESPGLFWISDRNREISVTMAPGEAEVTSGQRINVVGTVERAGPVVRIRASRVSRE